MAQSGLARLTGGQKVAGSNPVAPTKTRDVKIRSLGGICDFKFGAWRSLV